MRKILVMLMLAGLVSASQALVIDDFQSYTEAGAIADDTGGAWTAINGDADFPDIADDGAGNQYLANWQTGGWGNQRGAYMSLGENTIADGDVAILDFDMMAATDIHDMSFGLANGGSAGDWGDMEAYVTMKPNGDLELRDVGIVATDVIDPGTWYHFQIVADTATDTYDVYLDGSLIHTGAPFRNGADVEDLDAVKFIGYENDSANNPDNFVAVDNITLGGTTISNDSPINGAKFISVVRTDSDNDLVFTVLGENIVIADVYLSAGDPNATDLIVNDLEIGEVGHGEITKTVNLESLASDLSFETDYYWKVVGYEPNELIPTNIDIPVVGPVSKFTTAPQAPKITIHPPVYTAVDTGEPSVVLTAKGINGDLQWKKDGSAINDAVGVYAGTTTNELTIYDVQQGDEGYYTLEVSNLIESDESTAGRVMIHRQTSYYDFDSITSLPDGNDVFVDSIDGYYAVLMQEAASAGLPTASDANQFDLPVAFPGVNGNGLLLDNGDNDTDPNGQYLQIYPGVCDYEDITIMLWARPNSVAVYGRLFDFGNSQQQTIWATPDVGGYDPRFEIINSGDGQQLNPDLDSSNWIGSGSWHHIAVTISGDTGRMYVDGLLRATNTGMTINPVDLGTTLNYIGKSQWPDPEFDGLIDELKIYNYALSTVEIGQEYLMYADPTGAVCNLEVYDMGDYDANGDCLISLPDFAAFALRWLESDQITLP